jgi:hypothetical protein
MLARGLDPDARDELDDALDGGADITDLTLADVPDMTP